MKKIVVISDMHCGHWAGLTPPDYQWPDTDRSKMIRTKGAFQKELWERYMDIRERVGHIDLLLVNGDSIDGKAQGYGSTELITADRLVQAEMAYNCIMPWIDKDTKCIMSYGTKYHTGREEDLEKVIADMVGAEIHSAPFIDCEGIYIGMKHKISSSSIPHGRGTPLLREWVWNQLWAAHGDQPSCDLILRSHVHYWFFCGGRANTRTGKFIAMTTPGLQAANTKYGGRECSGIVDWGLIEFTVDAGELHYNEHLADVAANRSEAIKI